MCQATANSFVYYRHTACCGVLAVYASLAKTNAPLCWPIYAIHWTAMLRYTNMRILIQLWPIYCLDCTIHCTEYKQYLDMYLLSLSGRYHNLVLLLKQCFVCNSRPSPCASGLPIYLHFYQNCPFAAVWYTRLCLVQR